jgi:hypothetical protein
MPNLRAACTVRVTDKEADSLVSLGLAYDHPTDGLNLTGDGVRWFHEALAATARTEAS